MKLISRQQAAGSRQQAAGSRQGAGVRGRPLPTALCDLPSAICPLRSALRWLIPAVTIITVGCAKLDQQAADSRQQAVARRCRLPSALCRLPEDISAQRRQRTGQAVSHFEQQRDFAEFQAARERWLAGDHQNCIQRLQRLLARNPDHLDSRLLMAEALLGDNRSEEAIQLLEPAISAHPEDARVQNTMDLLLDATEQSGRAQARHRRESVAHQQAAGSRQQPVPTSDLRLPTSDLRPPSADCLLPEVYAVGCQEVVASDEVVRPLGGPPAKSFPATSLPQHVPRTQSTPGCRKASDVSGAEPAIVSNQPSAISNQPGQPTVIASFLVPAARGGHTEAAGSAGATSPGNDPVQAPESSLLQQGCEAIAAGETDVAFACFWEAMAVKPNDAQIPISAAVSALRHNRPDMGIQLLEQCTGLFPDSAALRRVLGTAYYRQGDYKSSQVALQQALSLDKSSALSYFLMGCTLVKLGQSEAAEMHFRQARMLDPRYTLQR